MLAEDNDRHELLTPTQLYEETGKTVQYWANLRWRGRGPRYVKLSGGRGSVRYRRRDLNDWLEANTYPGGQGISA